MSFSECLKRCINYLCRYYGTSRPTSDLSNSNLVYLSSRQALADVSTLKQVITAQYKLTDKIKWISFGGSYSGALSAWLRLKYPDVVDGAVATSAPVLAKFNFFEYLEVVGKSLGSSQAGGCVCVCVCSCGGGCLYWMFISLLVWQSSKYK